MNNHILCDSENHPIISQIKIAIKQSTIDASLLTHVKDLTTGDFLFLVSCNTILPSELLQRYKYVLVLHASDLPKGRGWNPHIWQVVNGESSIVVSLLEASEKLDSGDIWLQRTIEILETDIYTDINKKLFEAEIQLMKHAIDTFQEIIPTAQSGESTYYRKRQPEDSEINVRASIESQFNLLRVCDPDRFPAFMYMNGQRYTLKLEKS